MNRLRKLYKIKSRVLVREHLLTHLNLDAKICGLLLRFTKKEIKILENE